MLISIIISELIRNFAYNINELYSLSKYRKKYLTEIYDATYTIEK